MAAELEVGLIPTAEELRRFLGQFPNYALSLERYFVERPPEVGSFHC